MVRPNHTEAAKFRCGFLGNTSTFSFIINMNFRKLSINYPQIKSCNNINTQYNEIVYFYAVIKLNC